MRPIITTGEGKAVLRVKKPGLLTTVQDLGRFGYRSAGLPVAGATDKIALQLGNALLGNADNHAALEITLMGPVLEIQRTIRLAIAGADLAMTINGRSVPAWSAVTAYKGDVIRFGTSTAGCRAYLCVEGGIEADKAFGSRSTDLSLGLGGLDGRPVQAGDVISTAGGKGGTDLSLTRSAATSSSLTTSGSALSESASSGSTSPRHVQIIRRDAVSYMNHPVTVRVIEGPQRHHFTDSAWKTLLHSAYRAASDSNRVGVRLKGPILEHNELGADILSEPIPEGAIQVPKSGQPIALLADHRTVGGYAKIATAISVDIPKLAQLRPGDTVRFQAVSIEEAQKLLVEQRRWLRCVQRCWPGVVR